MFSSPYALELIIIASLLVVVLVLMFYSARITNKDLDHTN